MRVGEDADELDERRELACAPPPVKTRGGFERAAVEVAKRLLGANVVLSRNSDVLHVIGGLYTILTTTEEGGWKAGAFHVVLGAFKWF